MKFMFLDVESTGNGFDNMHGVLEIACEMWELNDASNEFTMLSKFSSKIKPNPLTKFGAFEDGILININKAKRYSFDDTAVHENVMFKQLVKWLDAYIVKEDPASMAHILYYAYDDDWDSRHLKNIFSRCINSDFYKYFRKSHINIKPLASSLLPNPALLAKETLQYYYGHFVGNDWDPGSAHSAVYDCTKCRQLYIAIIQKIAKKYKTSGLKPRFPNS